MESSLSDEEVQQRIRDIEKEADDTRQRVEADRDINLVSSVPHFEDRYKGYNYGTVKKIVQGGLRPVRQWSENRWLDRTPVNYEYVCDHFAMRVFLIWEVVADHERLSKEVKNEMKGMAHPDVPGCFAFPYAFIKANPRFSVPAAGERTFRRVMPIRDIEGTFDVDEPTDDPFSDDANHVVDWNGSKYRLQLSKRLYEMRDELIVGQNFIEDFLECEATGRELFAELKSAFMKRIGYVDLDEHWATFTALWIMTTYVFEQFRALSYLLLYSCGGQGKTRYLKTICYASHNGVLVEDPSEAAVFRQSHLTRATMCFDEADKMNEDRAIGLLGLWNSGYEEGHHVPRYNMEQSKLEKFLTYCPKAFATNKTLDSTLVSRCIRIPILATDDELVAYREPSMNDIFFQDMRRKMAIWAIDALPGIRDINQSGGDELIKKWKKRFSEISEVGKVSPRLMQIMRPILAMYDLLGLDEKFGTQASERDNIEKVVRIIANDKRASQIPMKDHDVLLALNSVARTNMVTQITSKSVLEVINSKTEGDSDEAITVVEVGKVLDKYFSDEKRKINGRTEWLYQYKDGQKRQQAVEKVLDRLGIQMEN